MKAVWWKRHDQGLVGLGLWSQKPYAWIWSNAKGWWVQVCKEIHPQPFLALRDAVIWAEARLEEA